MLIFEMSLWRILLMRYKDLSALIASRSASKSSLVGWKSRIPRLAREITKQRKMQLSNELSLGAQRLVVWVSSTVSIASFSCLVISDLWLWNSGRGTLITWMASLLGLQIFISLENHRRCSNHEADWTTDKGSSVVETEKEDDGLNVAFRKLYVFVKVNPIDMIVSHSSRYFCGSAIVVHWTR